MHCCWGLTMEVGFLQQSHHRRWLRWVLGRHWLGWWTLADAHPNVTITLNAHQDWIEKHWKAGIHSFCLGDCRTSSMLVEFQKFWLAFSNFFPASKIVRIIWGHWGCIPTMAIVKEWSYALVGALRSRETIFSFVWYLWLQSCSIYPKCFVIFAGLLVSWKKNSRNFW